jgi:hypothetical protein
MLWSLRIGCDNDSNVGTAYMLILFHGEKNEIDNSEAIWLLYNQSPAGIWSTAWRKTGSTFVYTLFVRSGEECSNNFCVTAVETPF